MAAWWSSSMEDANNWDLNAVVRGCSSTAKAALDPFRYYPTDNHFSNEELVEGEEDDISLFFHDAKTTKNALHELEELCEPFFPKPQQQLAHEEEPQRRVSHSLRSKRRKNQQKKVVCQVPADGLSSDMWAWRKYGQKPIKGSPHPRGYYRCSSLKGCLARKQVERSRTDPTMLVITYTAEHNHPVPTHRNSLAGSTRSKFPPLSSRYGEQNLVSNNKTSTSRNMTGLSPTTPLMDSMEDELLMPKGGIEEANDDDEEEEGMASDMVFTDSEKLGNLDIDDEDFVKKFFSNVWQAEGSTVGGAGGS